MSKFTFISAQRSVFYTTLLIALLLLPFSAGTIQPAHALDTQASPKLYLWSPTANLVLYWSLNSQNSGPGQRPYDLILYNPTTMQSTVLAKDGNIGPVQFSRDGASISYWYNDQPYVATLDGTSLAVQLVETDSVPTRGAFSFKNDFLIYISAAGEIRLRTLSTNTEQSLGSLADVSAQTILFPAWSPDDHWVALQSGTTGILLDPTGIAESIPLPTLELPQSEFPSDLPFFNWSANSSSLYDYTGSLLYTFSTPAEPAPAPNTHSTSPDGAYEILSAGGELFIQTLADNAKTQLTQNKTTIEQALQAQLPPANNDLLAQAAVADGFDFPVGKPNMTGFNTTAGCWWEQTSGLCAPGPHPGQDFNGNGGGDADLGLPVYAVAHGTVIYAQQGSGTAWGNIVLIEHNLPDGSKVWSQYAHLQTIKVFGGAVNKGDQIGTIGKGYNNIYYAHLHFEIRKVYRNADAWITGWTIAQVEQYYVNPTDYINGHRTLSGGTDNPPSGFTKCADENGRCNFSGTADVVYGARSSFTSARSFTNGVDCNNGIFSDPISGTAKACYYKITTPPASCPSVSGEVRIYDLTNCGGDSQTANSTGLWNYASSFNDRAESIAIPGGWSARLYQNDNENSGESACFSSTDSNLGDNSFANSANVANNLTWMRVYNNSSCTLASAPAVPAPTSPGNGSGNAANYNLNFQWNASSGASDYLIEWWGGPYGTMQPCGWSSSTSCQIGVIAAGNTYSWHVKARNSTGESAWSSTWTFTIQAPLPGAFNKSSPSNTASGQSTSPTLAWGASSNATDYYYCIDTSNDSACSTWYSSSSATSKTLSGLVPGLTYYWQVRSVNGSGMTYAAGSSSDFWSFSTQSINPPGAFNKTYPANAASSLSTNITLNWAASSGATSYAYCYDTSNDQLCSSWISNGSSLSVNLSGLTPNNTYYWQVRAQNLSGIAVYANAQSWWSFKTAALDNVYPSISWAAPIASQQVFTVPDQNITLQVNASDNVAIARVVFARWDYVNTKWVQLGTVSSAPYRLVLNTSTLQPAWNEIDATAVDTAGNSSTNYIWLNHVKKISLSLYSLAAEDGTILESTETSSVGKTLNSAAGTLLVGDATLDRQYRSILSFNTAGIPDNAVVTSAAIKLQKQSLAGTNPFSTHLGLVLDMRQTWFGPSAGLLASDFQAAASLMNAGTFSSTPVNNWYSANLNSTAIKYINKTGRTQIRLRFTKDDNEDNGNDYLAFYSGNAVVAATRPTLVIVYYVP